MVCANIDECTSCFCKRLATERFLIICSGKLTIPTFYVPKIMERCLGRRWSPDSQDTKRVLPLKRCCKRCCGSRKVWVVHGAISVVREKMPSISQPIGRSNEFPIHLFSMDWQSYRKKLLFLCKYVEPTLRDRLLD